MPVTAAITAADVQKACAAAGIETPDIAAAADVGRMYDAYATAHQATIARGRPWTFAEWLSPLAADPKQPPP